MMPFRLTVAAPGARFAVAPSAHVAGALSRFDQYVPGLELAGLPAAKQLHLQDTDDTMALAPAAEALRDGSVAAGVADVRAADQTATRRFQLSAADPRDPHFPRGWTLASPAFGMIQEQDEILRSRSHDVH